MGGHRLYVLVLVVGAVLLLAVRLGLHVSAVIACRQEQQVRRKYSEVL